MASRHGHTHLVRLLLDHGADVNLPSRGGVGPLHLAARFGHSATVELLLDKGNRNGTLVSIFGLCLTVFPTLACLRPNIHGQGHGRRGGVTPGGRRPGRGGGRKFFYPGGSLLVKIGQNFFT